MWTNSGCRLCLHRAYGRIVAPVRESADVVERAACGRFKRAARTITRRSTKRFKQIATAAYEELKTKLPGGVGDMTAPNGTGYRLTLLINTWSTPQTTGTRIVTPGANTNDYAAVNLGQLKNVAKLFYDRLIEVGCADTYPWENSSNPPNDYAMANIGQVKNLFAWDFVDGDMNRNGIPDWWELQYFNNRLLATAELDGDADGDGISNADEFYAGTNPGSQHSDTDGVPDGSDSYPIDANRSEDVPVNPLAVLDLSGTSTSENGVEFVALGDEGKAAFSVNIGPPINEYLPYTTHRIYKWEHGSLTIAHDLPAETYGLSAISASGDAIGTVDEGGHKGYHAVNGSISVLGIPGEGDNDTHFNLLASNGVIAGYLWESPYGSGDFILKDGIWTVFNDSYEDQPPPAVKVIPADFSIDAINGLGWAIGDGVLWNGSSFTQIDSGYPVALNDSGQVISSDTDADGRSNGYFWQPNADGSDGTSIAIKDLLPPVYRNQIRNIDPKLISNENPEENNTIHIQFEAESLEGSGTGSWVNRTFMLTTGTSPAVSGSNAKLRVFSTSDALQFRSITSSAILQATGSAGDAGHDHAYLAFDVHFEPADAPDESTIRRGFDPPMKTDKKFNQGNGGYVFPDLVTISDSNSKLQPIWWTSVGRTAGSGTGSQLNLNQNVKVVFSGSTAAKLCSLVVTDGTNQIGLAQNKQQLTSKETVLTITGTNSASAAVSTASIKIKGVLPSLGETPTLQASVMPVRNIALGIYVITDPQTIDYNGRNLTDPGSVPDVDTIISDLNKIYHQACITFTKHSSSGTNSMHHDLNKDGYLATESATNLECAELNKAAKAKLNVVIVARLRQSSDGRPGSIVAGICPPPGNIVYVFSQTQGLRNSFAVLFKRLPTR